MKEQAINDIKKSEKPAASDCRSLLMTHPVAAVLLLALIAALCAAVPILLSRHLPRTVTVTTDDSLSLSTVSYETREKSIGDFIKVHAIDYDKGSDSLDTSEDTAITGDLKITITKAVSIPVTCDGTTNTVTTTPLTVAELLHKSGITPDSDDIVEPAPDHLLVRGDKITVTRVEVRSESEVLTTPYSSETIYDSSVPIGDVRITQNGQDRKVTKTYSVTYHDGAEFSRELVSTTEDQPLMNEVTSIGTNMNTGVPAGLQYTRVLQGVRAVAYWYDGSPVGSYGLPCTYGTCAVDPDVIPLGTRLYIENYGYAIANDVGSGVQGYTVDLFMEDSDQPYMWGAHTVTVYILD